MKAKILEVVTRRPGASFAEFDRLVPGFRGTDGDRKELFLTNANVVLWAGLTARACSAIQDLIDAGETVAKPTVPLVYFIDGRVPKYPVARRIPSKGYKSPHWLPIVFYRPDHPEVACAGFAGLDPISNTFFEFSLKGKVLKLPLNPANPAKTVCQI